MDAKKGKTRKESTPIKVWVTPEEKAAIAAKADAHSLSASSYLRRNPWSQRLRPAAGRLKKGHFSTRILFKLEKRARRSFSLKPVPTLPANLSFWPS
jgi:hypothetical protein